MIKIDGEYLDAEAEHISQMPRTVGLLIMELERLAAKKANVGGLTRFKYFWRRLKSCG